MSAPHNTQTDLIEGLSVTEAADYRSLNQHVSSLARKYEYRRRLPHYQKADRAVFVTFRKLNTEPFPANARDLILQHCTHDDGKRFELHAAVVMPDHGICC